MPGTSKVDLLNKVNALRQQAQVLITEVEEHNQELVARSELSSPDAEPTQDNIDAMYLRVKGTPDLWLEKGKTDLQIGLMELTRAVAADSSFTDTAPPKGFN